MSDSDQIFILFICAILLATLLFTGWALVVEIPENNRQEHQFMVDCIQSGGVPSKYKTMVGKSSQEERLCIKKENVLEIAK